MNDNLLILDFDFDDILQMAAYRIGNTIHTIYEDKPQAIDHLMPSEHEKPWMYSVFKSACSKVVRALAHITQKAEYSKTDEDNEYEGLNLIITPSHPLQNMYMDEYIEKVLVSSICHQWYTLKEMYNIESSLNDDMRELKSLALMIQSKKHSNYSLI